MGISRIVFRSLPFACVLLVGAGQMTWSASKPPSAAAQTDKAVENKKLLETVGVVLEDMPIVLSLTDDPYAIQVLGSQLVTLKAMGLSKPDYIAMVNSAASAMEKAATEGRRDQAERDFLGFRWGMGVALSTDLESGPRVDSASVVNGIVRIDAESDSIPRIFLETHRLFELKKGPDGRARCGHGPFVGVQSSTDDVIDAIAFGYIIGWRPDAENSNGFGIGIGPVLDSKVQVLGDGIEANEPLPAGETTARLKTESRWGATLVFSLTF